LDAIVKAAIEKWPNVPHAFGWLLLNGNGDWFIKGSRVENATLINFINRNYCADDQGRWFFQNGPQRVYVRLDSTPYIALLQGESTAFDCRFQLHTGEVVGPISECLQDEMGSVYIVATDSVCQISSLLESHLIEDNAGQLRLRISGKQLITIESTSREAIAQRFRFIRNPQSAPGQPDC
jgi:hypothetical protein